MSRLLGDLQPGVSLYDTQDTVCHLRFRAMFDGWEPQHVRLNVKMNSLAYKLDVYTDSMILNEKHRCVRRHYVCLYTTQYVFDLQEEWLNCTTRCKEVTLCIHPGFLCFCQNITVHLSPLLLGEMNAPQYPCVCMYTNVPAYKISTSVATALHSVHCCWFSLLVMIKQGIWSISSHRFSFLALRYSNVPSAIRGFGATSPRPAKP